jgi:hypothetical protein
MLGGEADRTPLLNSKTQHVYVYAAFVPKPDVNGHMCSPFKFRQAVISHLTAQQDSSYVVPALITMDDLTMTPSATGNVSAAKAKHELPHVDFTTQWQAFITAVMSSQIKFFTTSTDKTTVIEGCI